MSNRDGKAGHSLSLTEKQAKHSNNRAVENFITAYINFYDYSPK